MKISTKGRYGLRAAIELAAAFGKGPLLGETIADNQSISGNYLHVLMGSLKSAGIVRAIRGPNGGYVLTRQPRDITAREVIEALEGQMAPVSCVRDADLCEKAHVCATHEVWCEIAQAVDAVLEKYTLADLVKRLKEKESQAVYYEI